jgi:hypothetical protein
MEVKIVEEEHWLTGWKAIGRYLGRSAKTAQRWGRDGMPFYRDPVGRPISKPSMIDEYLLDLNQSNYDDKTWQDEGIATSLSYESYREKQKKEFDQKFLEAQRPPRSRY